MRYLAIDYGLKQTGLAICDPTETFCSPLSVIAGQNGLLKKIVELVKTEDIGGIVMGLPLNMDDSAGPQAKLVTQFTEQLKKLIEVPVFFQDERLSTFAAKEKLARTELTRGKKKKRLDAIAAAEILSAFLEQKHAQ